MAKTAPKQKSTSKPAITASNRSKYLILAAVILFAGYFLVYRPMMIQRDKQRFEQAEASLEALYAHIESKVGKPDAADKDKSCGYASRKFERGPLGCSTYINFVYAVTDSNSATKILEEVDGVIDARSDLLIVRWTDPKGSFNEVTTERDSQEIGSSLQTVKGSLNCEVSYRYSLNDDSFLVITSGSQQKNLSIQLGCGGPAKTEHYPMRN